MQLLSMQSFKSAFKENAVASGLFEVSEMGLCPRWGCVRNEHVSEMGLCPRWGVLA